MKKNILCICLIILAVMLCSCKTSHDNAETKAIDFSEYTVDEVIAWANENNAAQFFNFVYTADSDKASGSIIAQSVECGKPITNGIEITVSTKPLVTAGSDSVIVPNVIGTDITSAREKLTALGFKVETKYERSSTEKDTVILSDPLPGITASTGSEILLTLSSGEKKGRQVTIDLNFKDLPDENRTIKVYINGEIDRSKTVTLNASVIIRTFTFVGTGKSEIKFKVNDEVFAVYQVDFDARTATEIK